MNRTSRTLTGLAAAAVLLGVAVLALVLVGVSAPATAEWRSPCRDHADCELKLIRAKQLIESKNARLKLKTYRIRDLRDELRDSRDMRSRP